jgi:DNA-binding IclR family transcriptional regulator
MPVLFDEYDDETGQMNLSEGTNAHAILVFLSKNPEQGYSPQEIADATDVKRGSVGPTLSRLENRELVRHKGEVWAIGEDDRLAAQGVAYVASSGSVADNYYSEGA